MTKTLKNLVNELESCLLILNESGVPYVLIGDRSFLPEMLTKNKVIKIFTAHEDQVSRLMGLRIVRKPEYYLEAENGESLKVLVFNKSRGMYPDRFETEILNSRHIEKNLFYVPDPNVEALMIIYDKLFRERNQFQRHEIQPMIQFVESRVGIKMFCRYKKYFPTVNPAED